MKTLILLFDIDGTLIKTGGAGQLAIESVVTTPAANNHQIRFAGRTDRGIMSDFFVHFGIEDTDENYEIYRERFLTALDSYLPQCDGTVLPRVIDTLDFVSAESRIHFGLITGNMRQAAKKKLTAYSLDHYFFAQRPDGIGGFGDRHRDRDDVARDALAEAREFLVGDADPQDIWIVGDTPNDVKCAKAIGANAVAVSTGSYTLDELQQTNADFVIESLDHAQSWWSHLAEAYDIGSPSFANV